MTEGQPQVSPFASYNGTTLDDAASALGTETEPDSNKKSSTDLRATALERSSTRSSTGAPGQTADELLLTGYLRRELSLTREGWDDLTKYLAKQTRVQKLSAGAKARMASVFSNAAPRGRPEEEQDLEDPEAPSGCWHNKWPREHSILGLPLIHPHSCITGIESIVMALVDATYSAFIVPIGVAFETGVNGVTWPVICDLVAGALFNLDIFILLHTGFVVTHNLRRKVIMNGPLIAWYYCRRGALITDVLSAIPFWAELGLIVIGNNHSRGPALQAFLALRLFRLVRLVRFIKGVFLQLGSRSGSRFAKLISSSVIYFVLTVYAACALINLLGCIWYFTARREGLANSWLTSVAGQDLTTASRLRQYVASIYYAMTTITTVGYGDITAHTAAEELVAIFIMFIGVLFFGFLIGSLGELLEQSSMAARRAAVLRNKFDDVEAWMRKRKLPREMCNEITSFYADIWARQADWKDEQFFAELPAATRSRVAGHMLRQVLQTSDIFRCLSSEARERIAGKVHPRMVSPGHDLCEQGEEADCMWILQEGDILSLRCGREVGVLEPPAVLGEAVILPELGRHRAFTFRAVTWCTVWELRLVDIRVLLNVYPELLDKMVHAFMERLLKRIRLSPDAGDKLEAILIHESKLGSATDRRGPVDGRPGSNMQLGEAMAAAVAGDITPLQHMLEGAALPGGDATEPQARMAQPLSSPLSSGAAAHQAPGSSPQPRAQAEVGFANAAAGVAPGSSAGSTAAAAAAGATAARSGASPHRSALGSAAQRQASPASATAPVGPAEMSDAGGDGSGRAGTRQAKLQVPMLAALFAQRLRAVAREGHAPEQQ